MGERIRAAYTAGRVAEAQALLAGFAKFEEAFGPDLAAVRKDLAALTLESTTESTGQLERTLWIGAGLFAFASLAGLGLSGVFSTRMHRAVHRLIDGTQALEGGQFTVTVHIQSRDEIGQLSQAQIELRGLFSEGLDAYRRQDWDLAERRFRECVRVREDDGPARLFLERVALLRRNPPPPDWDGVWRLTQK